MKWLKKIRKIVLLVWVTGAVTIGLYAQQPADKSTFLHEMSNLKEHFYKAGNISFDLCYYYSNEHSPRRYIDSLKGHIEMSGNKSRIVMDNTETISTGKYTIILAKEDKVMYLAKGMDSLKQQLNPLAAMDTMFSKIEGLTYKMSVTGRKKNYTIEFPAGYPCKKMEMIVDATTQRVLKTISVVRTADVLQDPESYSVGKNYEEYTNIETRFINYRTGVSDTAIMDENRYFIKENGEFKVTDLFKGYTIYKGMPGL